MGPQGDVLLTGATGFVGSFLLAELLESSDARVHCLVRATTEDGAQQRLRHALERIDRWRPGYAARLHPLVGDLPGIEPGLGRATTNGGLGRVTDVYHCAAAVRAGVPPAALHEANVVGTQRALDLVPAARFHHVSTIAVAREPDAVSSSNGYVRTKHQAERLVAEAVARGRPARVYRLGAVAGDTISGYSNPDDYRWQIVRATVQMRLAPALLGGFTWTPVDHVARALLRLARLDEAPPAPHHLIGSDVVAWDTLWSWVRRAGYRINLTSVDGWRQRLDDHARSTGDDGMAALAAVVTATAADTPSATDEPTRRLTDVHGVSCGSIDAVLLGRYLHAAAGDLPRPDHRDTR